MISGIGFEREHAFEVYRDVSVGCGIF